MKMMVIRWILVCSITSGLHPSVLIGQTTILDECESLTGWSSFASDGVNIVPSVDSGCIGKALRIDYRFEMGSGYGGITRSVSVDLPANFQISFSVKAKATVNNFEIKFTDTSGQNVWWVNKRNFEFPAEWKKVVIKKRHISFAWGPDSRPLTRIGRIEFTVTAGSGGSGSVFIDHIQFERLAEPLLKEHVPMMTSSSALSKKNQASYAFDDQEKTSWISLHERRPWLMFDFGFAKEFGGIVVAWGSKTTASSSNIEISHDGKSFELLASSPILRDQKSYQFLPESEARYVRLSPISEKGKAVGEIREVEFLPPMLPTEINRFFRKIGQDAPRGDYPKYLTGEASYWTIAGAPSSRDELLINEEGMIELAKGYCSLEPFVAFDTAFYTWNDVQLNQSLQKKYLPLPQVEWKSRDWLLQIRALVGGNRDLTQAIISYELVNKSPRTLHGSLSIAIRPFQVNPPYQELNFVGGAAKIWSLEYDDNRLTINKKKTIYPLSIPATFGAANFADGNIVSFLRAGTMPQASNVVDSSYGYASGAFRYVVTLQPGESKTFSFAIPDSDKNIVVNDSGVRQEWESTVNRIEINLPKKYGPLMDMIRSQLAYILINKDGPTIQPGSRSYERGWIRDGSMTSAALLRMGLTTDVREYLDWYSRHQYPSGKIPCIVDSRGPEPTPENDSPGQYLFALLQYFYFTHDTLFLKTKWENVQKTVSYIQSLRAERMIDRYRSGNDSLRAFYGLVTESISHEGYSAKPMHSYWDNFFVLRGLKDAATIARVIGERNVSVYYDSLARAFRTNLLESFLLTMRNHSIDYLPGCVELGDFDATSTTVSLYPCGEKDYLPQLALRNTFKKYLEFFDHRIQKDAWINFTPYEIRIVGSLVYLGMKEDAHRVLDWLMSYRRPPGWNHWAEVVWRDSKTPQYIGDMPHTWVGSDYVNAFRAMFAYEEEEDSVLVIGAGIRDAWLQEPEGISVSNVPTYYGLLSFSIMPSGRSVIVDIKETLTAKRIVVKSPLTKPIRIARINGVQMAPIDASEIRIEKAPARIELEY